MKIPKLKILICLILSIIYSEVLYAGDRTTCDSKFLKEKIATIEKDGKEKIDSYLSSCVSRYPELEKMSEEVRKLLKKRKLRVECKNGIKSGMYIVRGESISNDYAKIFTTPIYLNYLSRDQKYSDATLNEGILHELLHLVRFENANLREHNLKQSKLSRKTNRIGRKVSYSKKKIDATVLFSMACAIDLDSIHKISGQRLYLELLNFISNEGEEEFKDLCVRSLKKGNANLEDKSFFKNPSQLDSFCSRILKTLSESHLVSVISQFYRTGKDRSNEFKKEKNQCRDSANYAKCVYQYDQRSDVPILDKNSKPTKKGQSIIEKYKYRAF